MKKIISIFLLLATVATVSAQRFEWAKGFESCYDDNTYIQSAVTDSLGNLYIIGSFKFEAEWMSDNGGIPLLPEITSHYGVYDFNVLIAKISPEGEMLWKKVVANDNNGGCRPYGIKLVGDTAIACMFDFEVPTHDARCYYLDTLLLLDTCPQIPPFVYLNYPSYWQDFFWHLTLAFVTFDFDGKVLEDHFIRLTAVDNEGNDIVANDGTLDNLFIERPSFNIDRDGNIYLYRVTNDKITDSLSADKGAFSAIKIWDDTVLVGSFPVEGNPQRFWQQVLKFSPHFDTLLASRYTIQKSDVDIVGHIEYPQIFLDQKGNVYTIATISNGRDLSAKVVVDSMQNIFFNCRERDDLKGYMIRYDSNLNVKWIFDFEDSINDSHYQEHFSSLIYDVAFDEDSNLVFFSTQTGKWYNTQPSEASSILMYRGNPLDIKKGGCIMSVRNSDTIPDIYSYTKDPTTNGMVFGTAVLTTQRNLVCDKNRLFIQSQWLGGVRYGDVNILPSDTIYDKNLGFFVFDYAGNVITHNSYDIDNRGTDRPGPIALRDSILYLMPDIWTHATFGETTIHSCQRFACIAKYVDTSFMSLYVRPEPDAGIRPPAAMSSVTLYPNPATSSLSIVSDTPVAQQAYIINSIGIRMPATIQNNTLDVSRLSPGNYFLETYINNNKVITKFVKL